MLHHVEWSARHCRIECQHVTRLSVSCFAVQRYQLVDRGRAQGASLAFGATGTVSAVDREPNPTSKATKVITHRG